MLTRVFKSGNSLAVRIPKELAIVEASQDVEIEKIGDTLVLRPVVKRKLTGLAEAFAMFTPDFMAEGREFHEQKERDWSGFGEGQQVHQNTADYKQEDSK
ncbi:MAG: AbrB/MazE/SpoVT family DNA-binding domain-containing protein [Thiobacillus sp.]|nr:AbrB/MazE/SpoVT family DNA-binding domain-containing protein [Thiobacillus sp.]